MTDPRIDRSDDLLPRGDETPPHPPTEWKARTKNSAIHPRQARMSVRERHAFLAGYFAALAHRDLSDLRMGTRSPALAHFLVRFMRANWKNYWRALRDLTENPKTRRNW